jgi:lysophospholipase L1-like esterase
MSLPFDENWPGYLGMLLRKNLPDKKIRIINAAVPGFDTAQSIGNLSLRVVPFKPDIVIIYHAYNDLKAIRYDVTFQPDYSHFHTKPYGYHKKPNFIIRCLHNCMFYVRARNKYREYQSSVNGYERLTDRKALMEDLKKRLSHIPKQAAQTFEQHMRALVSIAESGDAKVILSSFATLHDPKMDWSNPMALKALSDFQKKKLYSLMHFTPGLTLTAVFEGFNQYNELLHRIAVQENAGWVDNASLVPHEDIYFLDRVHFSSEGAKQVAENFLPVVLEKLKEL